MLSRAAAVIRSSWGAGIATLIRDMLLDPVSKKNK